MALKISFTVHKGSLSGKSFVYTSKESLILVLGRAENCSIVLPELTVSRYHCLLDIAPPSVMARDLDSLNGTFVNGVNIGRRSTVASAGGKRFAYAQGIAMVHGDRLRLGDDCELILSVENVGAGEQAAVPYSLWHAGKDCLGIEKQSENGRRNEESPSRAKEKSLSVTGKNHAGGDRQTPIERHCRLCHKIFPGSVVGICESCCQNPSKVLMFLLEHADNGDDVSELSRPRPFTPQPDTFLEQPEGIPGYLPMGFLGKGGMGGVWLVEEGKTGKRMAVKFMLPEAAVDEYKRKRFLREAALTTQLRHENIVRHDHCGQVGDMFFIFMEPCDGGSVGERVRQSGRLEIALATRIILQVLDGLIYAHTVLLQERLADGSPRWVRGIVHRDLQPENIVLHGGGMDIFVKIADFGLAKAFETAGLSGHTRTGDRAGTAMFMPRQQIIDFKYAKPAVDVWAAAASYYYMLTGACPKDFASGEDGFAVGLLTDAIPVRERNSDIPERLAEVIDLALAEEPDIGVQSAVELKNMITDAL